MLSPFPRWLITEVKGQSQKDSSWMSPGMLGVLGGFWAVDIDWSLAFLMSCPTTCFNLAHNEGERQQFLPPQPAPPALMS